MGIFGKLFGEKAPDPKPLEPVEPAAITAELIAEARAQGVTGALRVEGNFLFIDDGDGAERHIFLGNLANEYAAASATARPQLIAKYARLAIRPIRVAKPDLRTRVLPKVVPRREREAIKLRLPDGAQIEGLLAGRPIAGGELLIDLAVDEPEMIRTLTASDLVSITEAQAHACALDNLRIRSKQPWKQIAPGLWHSPWEDQWDGARLALPEIFKDLSVDGKPIAVAPNRNAVLVTGTREARGLAMLYPCARALVERDRPLHLAPLVLDGGAWRELDEARDFDAIKLAPSILFLSTLQSSLDHEICGELVRARLLERGFSHVIGVRPVELDGIHGPRALLAEYVEGERVAIARATMVRFDQSIVMWLKLAATLGDDLVPLDIWPPHFEIRRAPTAAELARVRVPDGR